MPFLKLPRWKVLRANRRLAALWQDRSGVAIIEFAIVGPVFLGLLIAVLNTMLVFLAQAGLETAAEGAGRLLLTGAAQTTTVGGGAPGLTAAQFKTAICSGISGTDANGSAVTYPKLLPSMLECSRLTVNVAVVNGYNNIGTVAPTFTYDAQGTLVSTGTGYNAISSGSGQNKIVVLQLIYLWPTTTGPNGFNVSNQPNNNRMIIATSVVSTENYSCGSGSTC